MSRVARLQSLLADLDADAVFVSHLPDIRWACGFTGSNAVLVVRPDETHFVTDGRYRAQAVEEVSDAQVHAPGYDLIGHVAEAKLFGDARRVALQAEHVSVARLSELQRRLPEMTWQPEEELLVRLVASKEPAEVERIRAAQRLTEDVFAYLLDWIRPGRTEKEIAAQITYRHLLGGAEAVSFAPIVASGPHSARPHARPTDRRVQEGDVLLLDFGGVLEGYASDMTRVLAIGQTDPEVRRVYDLVRRAQERALSSARSGLVSRALDARARQVIDAEGYGASFSHGLGHGVGLQVHEWPRVSYSADYLLPEGAVVSIEPGIYLPGRFGIRLEDLVVLRDDGCENLTRASKEWTVL